jgi:hypothetical protein
MFVLILARNGPVFSPLGLLNSPEHLASRLLNLVYLC